MDKTLVETEIAYPLPDLSIFHQKRAVAGHASDNLFIRIDFA